MKIIRTLFGSILVSSALLGVSSIATAQATKAAAPRVFIIDGPTLEETKRRIKSGDETFAAAELRVGRFDQHCIEFMRNARQSLDVGQPVSDDTG